jgi:hypothetical protein
MNSNYNFNNEINDERDNHDSEDDIDLSVFNNSNTEFIEFKNNVKEWITLDDDITTLQKAIKARKTKKDDLTPKILDFMKNNKVNDLNTNDGSIKCMKSTYTKPLNKKYLISRLGDFFKDLSKGEKVAGFILDNRDKEEKFRIKRVVNKKTINI